MSPKMVNPRDVAGNAEEELADWGIVHDPVNAVARVDVRMQEEIERGDCSG